MSDKIIQFDDAMFESKLDAVVRVKVEQTINAMLDAEADEIANAARYERKTDRKAFRAGHCERTLAAKAGKLSLKVPELKGALFGSAVIERCRRRESSVEEALMEMCLAGVSTRGVDDISRLLWGERMPSRTLSDKLKKIYKEIDEWRKRPLGSEYPYVFVDGVWRKRSWGGSVENVSVLVAIGVSTEGWRDVCVQCDVSRVAAMVNICSFQGHRYRQRRPVADRFKATDPLWSGFEHGDNARFFAHFRIPGLT